MGDEEKVYSLNTLIRNWKINENETEEKKRLYQCRYFANQEKNPYSNGQLEWFWDMERTYVYGSGMSPEMDEYYKNIDGKDYEGIPHELLIILFTSWAKGSYDKKRNYLNVHLLMNLSQKN